MPTQPSPFSGPPAIYIDGSICFRVVAVGFFIFATFIVLGDLLQRIHTAKHGQFAEGYIKQLIYGKGRSRPTPLIAFTLPNQLVIEFMHNSSKPLLGSKVGTPVRVLYDPTQPKRAYWFTNSVNFYGTPLALIGGFVAIAYIIGTAPLIAR